MYVNIYVCMYVYINVVYNFFKQKLNNWSKSILHIMFVKICKKSASNILGWIKKSFIKSLIYFFNILREFLIYCIA